MGCILLKQNVRIITKLICTDKLHIQSIFILVIIHSSFWYFKKAVKTWKSAMELNRLIVSVLFNHLLTGFCWFLSLRKTWPSKITVKQIYLGRSLEMSFSMERMNELLNFIFHKLFFTNITFNNYLLLWAARKMIGKAPSGGYH